MHIFTINIESITLAQAEAETACQPVSAWPWRAVTDGENDTTKQQNDHQMVQPEIDQPFSGPPELPNGQSAPVIHFTQWMTLLPRQDPVVAL